MNAFELVANDEMIAWLKVLRRPGPEEEPVYHGFFPAENVAACLDVSLDPLPFRHKQACPLCARAAHHLRWVKYSSPADAWARGGGTMGALSLCDHCGIQVQFLADQA
jgi:hypothetical protein